MSNGRIRFLVTDQDPAFWSASNDYLEVADGGGAGEEAEHDHPVVVGHQPVQVRAPNTL